MTCERWKKKVVWLVTQTYAACRRPGKFIQNHKHFPHIVNAERLVTALLRPYTERVINWVIGVCVCVCVVYSVFKYIGGCCNF